jgi:hypothetical protein
MRENATIIPGRRSRRAEQEEERQRGMLLLSDDDTRHAIALGSLGRLLIEQKRNATHPPTSAAPK